MFVIKLPLAHHLESISPLSNMVLAASDLEIQTLCSTDLVTVASSAGEAKRQWNEPYFAKS